MKKGIFMRRILCLLFAAVLTAAVAFPALADEKRVEIPSCFGYTRRNGVYTITGYYGDETKVVIPEGVEVIGSSAFEDDYDLTEVVLPNSIKKISYRAFACCSKLKKINFPDGLEYVGESSFCGTAVEKVWLPDSVKTLGNHAFGGSGCVEVRLPEGLKMIEWWTFDNCHALKTVELPSTLKVIGYSAFSQCLSLELVIPEGVTHIDQMALCGVKSIHFPMSVIEYGDYFIDDYDKPEISTPRFNKALSLALYGYDGTKHPNIKIKYTEADVGDALFVLAEDHERKVITDLDFCGDPELIQFDKYGYGKIFFQSYDKLCQADISGVRNNRIYFGETDRKLYHLKDKSGRQLILFTVFRNDKNFPAKTYILEPTYIDKEPTSTYYDPTLSFSCKEIGSQKLVSVEEQNGRVKFTAEQTAGEHYSLENGECSREELFPTLRKLMKAETEKYIGGFEVVGEYDLESFFEDDFKSDDYILGSFSAEATTYEPIKTETVYIAEQAFDIEANHVKLYLGVTCESIDFDALAKLKNLSVLEISAENVMSLKGIEKLENLRSLTLISGRNGGFSDMEQLDLLHDLKLYKVN